MINEKYFRNLKKNFKYQHSQWLKDNENYFNETKEFFKGNKINNERVKKITFFILLSKWKVMFMLLNT